MRVSEKELGLTIIYLQEDRTELAFYKNKIADVSEYDKNLSLSYQASPNKKNSFKLYSSPEQEDIIYFEENFKIIEVEKVDTISKFYSDKYNVWFEVDEEVILYWNLKYSFQ